MDPSPPPPAPVVPTAPPTEPGEISIRLRAPVWPTPLGIVYIVFGVFGGITALVGALTTQMSVGIIKSFPGAEATAVGMEKYSWEHLASQSAEAVCALLLLVCGIFVLLKRRRVVPMIVVWAILKILAGIGGALLAAAMQKIQMEATLATIAQQRPNAPQQSAAVMSVVSNATMGFTIFFTVLIASALPVFSLIWFRLASVRATVAGWRR